VAGQCIGDFEILLEGGASMRRLARRNQAGLSVLVLVAIFFALNAASAFAATPPVNTVPPSLSGTAKDGVAITANKGTWTGVATITYTYQWQASSDGGATWSDIAGATATTYTPPAGSAGTQVRVIVTATNGDGTSQATSPASAVIVANPPVNTVAPSISGTPKDGVAMTAAKGTWTGMATITYTYQWQLSADGGITWANIPGATSTSYTPPAGTAGKQARVLVTGTNPDGSSQAASPASAFILPKPPAPTAGSTPTTTPQPAPAQPATPPAAPAEQSTPLDARPTPKQPKPKPKPKKPKPKHAKQKPGKPKPKHAPQPPRWHLVPR
jgi:hypothetical protein